LYFLKTSQFLCLFLSKIYLFLSQSSFLKMDSVNGFIMACPYLCNKLTQPHYLPKISHPKHLYKHQYNPLHKLNDHWISTIYLPTLSNNSNDHIMHYQNELKLLLKCIHLWFSFLILFLFMHSLALITYSSHSSFYWVHPSKSLIISIMF
jgi:hypothetical protein